MEEWERRTDEPSRVWICRGLRADAEVRPYEGMLAVCRLNCVTGTTNRCAVPVAVWEITADHEYMLDRYEGYPHYYRKITCTVDMKTGERIQGMTYQMCEFEFFPPDISYFEGIRDAYEALGLRLEIKRMLRPALMRSCRLAEG